MDFRIAKIGGAERESGDERIVRQNARCIDEAEREDIIPGLVLPHQECAGGRVGSLRRGITIGRRLTEKSETEIRPVDITGRRFYGNQFRCRKLRQTQKSADIKRP